MDKTYFLKQLESLISFYGTLVSQSQYDDFSDLKEETGVLITRIKASVERIVGIESIYYKQILEFLDMRGYVGNSIHHLIGVVKALKLDLEDDYLKSVGEIITSEVFINYIDMAEYLLNTGYKDPAAVIAGSTLEIHMKKICLKNNIPTEYQNSKQKMVNSKCDSLNAELCKNAIFNSAKQKQITAWLAIRNDAAHGKYENYSKEDVEIFIKGLINFIGDFPA
jgi:hypothetical protein